VKIVDLDAQFWTKPGDFYAALFAALGAPHWHGKNPNALIDSMIYGGTNEVAPPYRIVIRGTENLSPDVACWVAYSILALGDAGAWGCGIEFQTSPMSAEWVKISN
jgi:Barstar (barnase inhibitor)